MSQPALPDQPDWSKYPAGLWGFAGVDRQRVTYCRLRPAVRSRIGHRGLYKAGFCRLSNGDLLASPCYQADDGKWRMKIFRCGDEGKTWTEVPTSGAELLGKEPALTTLRDGSVLLVTSHPHGFRVHRSGDGGRSWEVTELGDGLAMIRNVLEDDDGTLTLVMSKGTYYKPSAPPSKGWLYRSKDKGVTWPDRVEIKVWNKPEAMFDEGAVVRLPDGRLLAAGRVSGDILVGNTPPPRGLPTPSGDEAGDHMVIMESSDKGLTWSEPRPLTNYAAPHAHLLVLQDGQILCTYASYHQPYGVVAMLSEDGGKTWDRERPIRLALSLNPYTGWPTSIQLPDGDIVTVYAATAYLEGEGVSLDRPGKGDTVAEAVRWKLPPPK